MKMILKSKNINSRLMVILQLVIIILVLNQFLSAGLNAKKTHKMFSDDYMSLISREMVENFISEAMPLIENATEKRFKKIPEILLMNQDDRSDRIEYGYKKESFLHQDEKFINNDISFKEKKMREHFELIGRYNYVDNTLQIMLNSHLPFLKGVKNNQYAIYDFIKLTCVHELIHALQAQILDIENMYLQRSNNEESEAFSITLEGHAIFIEEKIATQIDLGELFNHFMEHFNNLIYETNDPLKQIVADKNRTKYEYMYILGKKFIEYYHKKGGNEEVWEILANPPVNTEMIINPENYSPVSNKKIDFACMLEGLDGFLGDKIKIDMNHDLPKSQIWSIFSDEEEKVKYDIINGIEHIQNLTLKNPYDPSGYISIILLKDAEYGSKLLQLQEKAVKKNYEKFNKSSDIKISEFYIGKWSGIQADITRKISFIMTLKKKDQYKFEYFRSLHGKILIEINVINNQINDEQVIDIAQEILGRYVTNAKTPTKKKCPDINILFQ